ncbi:hypothetical protein C8J56DRAFT_1046458 [Mycena floridula]|nr:hypothetical protein C8J56DRAFT_1046458 [Mycena floridula]
MATFVGTPQAAVRIASLSVLIYDFLITIPSEIRLYKRQKSLLKLSLPCILFVLSRYIGLFYICWASFVFFGTGWKDTTCSRVAPVGAVLRSLVSSTSAAVFIWRTWAIWGKNKYIWISMCLALIPVTVFSYVPGLVQVPVVVNGGCTAVSRGDGPLEKKWTFALANLLFDTMACILGSIPLIRNVRTGNGQISSILLTDGLGYFFVAVIAQSLNLSFLLNQDKDKQGTMLTLQTIITTILAQRIITSLSERTASVPSQHDSHSRTRSQSRSRSIWKHNTRPPVPIRTLQDNSANPETGSMSTHDVEMIKVEVRRETHHDAEEDLGSYQEDRKKTQFV